MFDALVAPERCRDQAELLQRFDLPIALMQDAEALERIAYELVETKAADNVRYVEVRWGPLLHVARGLSLADGIAAVVRGTRAAADRYGDRGPAHRDRAPLARPGRQRHARRDRRGVPRATASSGSTSPDRRQAFPDPLVHERAFAAARAGGLQITLHAGEWGGAPQVRRALAVDPERIAHGPGAIDDPDLCRELVARGVTLDLCPTSNVQAGIVASVEDHPLARLHRARRPGHALDRRHDGLRHHPVRGVRPRRRADRAEPRGAVGDRPPRPRRRVRRRRRRSRRSGPRSTRSSRLLRSG